MCCWQDNYNTVREAIHDHLVVGKVQSLTAVVNQVPQKDPV